MSEELIPAARRCRLCQGSVSGLVELLPDSDEELDRLIGEIVAAKDVEAFTPAVLAALHGGRQVDARHLVDGCALFPKPDSMVAAALHLSGDVAAGLVQAVAKGRMGSEREAAALVLAAHWARERRSGVFPSELSICARRMAREQRDYPLVQMTLRILVGLTGDQALASILDANANSSPNPDWEACVEDLVGPCRRYVLAHLPESPPPVELSGYTVRRAVERVGRNDPCPCGSGKKYKKCCLEQDQRRLLDSSEVEGLTREELRERLEEHVTARQIREMRSYEAARLDPLKLPPELLGVLLERLLLFDDFESVLRVFKAVGVPERLEEDWRYAVEQAARKGEKEMMTRLLRLRPESEWELEEHSLGVRLLLDAERENPTLDLIEKLALEGLRGGKRVDLVEVGYGLLEGPWPALGILVARGLIPVAMPLEGMTLMDVLLHVRDKLGLTPEEPLEQLLEERLDAESKLDDEENVSLQQTREQLERRTEELVKMRSELAHLQRELERKERLGRNRAEKAVEAAPDRDDPALVALRQRLEWIRSDLKQRHAERNQLRRELEETRSHLETLRQQEGRAVSETDWLEETEEQDFFLEADAFTPQPVRLPQFPHEFRRTLAGLPRGVGRAAMALIGRLAAGEPAAFRGTRRLRAKPSVFRQRVGRSYRLLFQLQPEILEVVALVNRKDLERKIKSL